ncbi:hypothetical protein [Cryobacterium sp. AP23]
MHPAWFQVQWDFWFSHEALTHGYDQVDTQPVMAMTSTVSEFIQERTLPTRTISDLLGGIWSKVEEASAVPITNRT